MATGTLVGSAVLLVTEALAALVGDVSLQPSDPADAAVGSGGGRPVRLVILGDSTGVPSGPEQRDSDTRDR